MYCLVFCIGSCVPVHEDRTGNGTRCNKTIYRKNLLLYFTQLIIVVPKIDTAGMASCLDIKKDLQMNQL